MRRKYRAVIFDAGGTLIGQDDRLGFEKDLSATFGALGVSLTAQQIQALMPGLQTAATRRRKRIGGWSRTPEEDTGRAFCGLVPISSKAWGARRTTKARPQRSMAGLPLESSSGSSVM